MHVLPSRKAVVAPILTGIIAVTAASTSLTTAAPSSTTTLPALLIANVPTCAQPCLAYYISQQYVGICDGKISDASCLCDKYSSGGYALGELAYLCLNQECGSTATKDRGKVYTICSQYAQAVEPTHATLTVLYATYVTPSSTNTIQTSSSLVSSLTTSLTSESQLQTSGFAILASTTPSITAYSTSTSATTTPSSYPDTALPSTGGNNSSKKLTPGQTAGIVLGVLGGLLAALGAVYLCVRLRRRKRDQMLLTKHYEKAGNDSQDPGTGPSPPSPIPFEALTGPRTPSNRSAHTTTGPFQDRPGSVRNLGIGQAAMSSQQGARSRQFGGSQPYLMPPRSMPSQESLRRNSRLLPDKPIPPPLVLSQYRSVDGMRSPNYLMASHPVRGPPLRTPTTIPEEERSLDSATLPPHIFGMDNYSKHGNAVEKDKPVAQRLRPQRSQALSLHIPSQASPSGIQNLRENDNIAKDTNYQSRPKALMSDAQTNQQIPIMESSSPTDDRAGDRHEASILRYYANASTFQNAPNSRGRRMMQSGVPMPSADGYAHIPTDQSRKPVKFSRKLTRPRPSRRDSAGSETSFESADPDEPTPPEEHHPQLSPVYEQSPITGLKYPKVPRSANQVVPRSPPLPSKQKPMIAKPFFMKEEAEQRDSSIAFGAPYPFTPQRQNTTDSNLSGSTLAAKRRGDSVTRDLERMLDVNEYSTNPISPYQNSAASTLRTLHYAPSRQESPLKGYGKSQQTPGKLNYSPNLMSNNQIHESDFAMKTPPWEPVFTPRRHGHDLYLSVN